ncbi:MAG TPA: DUF5683 domain-containing protein [Candidatus Kryptonia bacterium]
MKKIFLTLIALSATAAAQSKASHVQSVVFLGDGNSSQSRLTGVLSHDLFVSKGDSSHEDSISRVETRSALKAGFFSLVIPGAGQLYNGNYWKAAGFFAVEVAGWMVNAVWNQKGNNQTNFFQNYADGSAADKYADGHYSVARYAQWIQQNYKSFEDKGIPIAGGQYAPVTDPTTVNNYISLILPSSGGPAPWDEVNWVALNKVEAALGGYFSHMLPAHGEQQYYELIGKYPQFREGWYDENLAITSYDSLRSDTPNSGYYMGQRGKANNLYAVALTAVNVVIANHFVSAIEAALWAHNNKRIIEPTVGLSPLPDGLGYQTEVRLAIHF